MDSVFKQHKDQLQSVAKKWFAKLQPTVAGDAQLVRRALSLFQEQQVEDVHLENSRLTGVVHDDARETVKVDLFFLEMSSCTCPANYYCRHQLAVFFVAYNEIASVEQLIEKWRAPAALDDITEQFGLKRARSFVTEPSNRELSYEEMVVHISTLFDETFRDGVRSGNSYMFDHLFTVYTGKLKLAAPDKQEWRHLYYVIVSLITFKKMMNLCRLAGCDELAFQRQYKRIFTNVKEMADRNIRKLHVHSVPFSFDTFIEGIGGELERMLVLDKQADAPLLSHELIGFYALFWDKFLKKNSWRLAERERLETLLAKTPLGEQRYIYSMCYAQLLFLFGEDEAVLAHLEKTELRMIEHVVAWMEQLRTIRNWKRFELYFNFVFEASPAYVKSLPLDGAREQFAQLLAQEAHHFCAAHGKFDLYEKVLTDMLPYSLRISSDYFFQQEQFGRWVEVMTLQQYGVNDINAYKLKVIEKADVRLLLPLYHQSIARLIDLKNRNNYRQAVKQLQKLQKIYGKLGETDRWHMYVKALLKKTRRLRAFQEECRLGKIVPKS